jgi:hypothetical protein
VIEIHDALLEAVHEQPAPAAMETVPSAPDAGTDRVSGEMANVHPSPCRTVTVRPATVMVPDREGPLVGAAVNPTDPDPLPLSPDVMVIHEAPLDALHAHPAPVVTVTLPLPPPEGIVWVSGAIAYVQPWPCTTVTVCPPMVREPVRAGPLAAATAKLTVPPPLPLAAPVMVIHGTLLAAVHAHPLAVFTVTVRVPPLASTVCERGDTSKAQPGDCVTVNAWPAIVAVPLRGGPVVPATVTPTVPLPVPEFAESDIQLTSLAAVHGQPGAAVMATVVDPPADPAAYLEGAML